MFLSVELNTVHVTVVAHSKVIEVNTCSSGTNSTNYLWHSGTVTFFPLVLGMLTISVQVYLVSLQYSEHIYQFFRCVLNLSENLEQEVEFCRSAFVDTNFCFQ